MAVASAGTLPSARALEARHARPARALALVIDLVISSILYAIVNNVYGIPGEGAPWLVLVLVWLAYVTVPEALYGATLGKMLTGVCVVRVDGTPLGMTEILLRNACRFVDALPLLYLLGGVWVLMGSQSRRIGDYVAGTAVIQRSEIRAPRETRRPFRGAGRLLIAVIAFLTILTSAFNYFGRPPLVVEGAYRAGQLGLESYQLGAPAWSPGEVSYPISGIKSGVACTGHVQLRWSGIGWEMSGWDEYCPTPAAS